MLVIPFLEEGVQFEKDTGSKNVQVDNFNIFKYAMERKIILKNLTFL